MHPAKFLSPQPLCVFERERLMNKLLSWEDKKLVLIHAQAGQGKSTLAAEYVRSLAQPSVWYHLDQEDDNPVVFLTQLGHAVRQTWPGRVNTVPPVPQNSYGPGRIQQGFDQWFRQVFGGLIDPVRIVFDDFSAAGGGPLPRLLTLLIASTPPSVRFMLISRARPDLEIAKLRAAQSVGELTGEDLRFTDAEVRDLFSLTFRMEISPNEAALINASAEGWPAGLVLMHEYLAALSPTARAHALIDRRTAGFRTHVFDYLAQEVFAHLSADMQRFLLRTSITDYLSVPLMELLAGPLRTASRRAPSIASMVSELRNRNLFVTAMDNDGSVIRYHALFREFLRKKLIAQTKPSEVKRLYTAAANHFLNAGDLVRSVDLLIASGRFEAAIKHIESGTRQLIARGRVQTLIRWMETLPLEYADRPWFLLSRAAACRYVDPRSALLFFDLAFKGFRSGRSVMHRTAGLMLSLCGTIEACFYSGGDFKRMERAAATAQGLLRRTTRESSEARARLRLALGTACFFIGRLRSGAEALQDALDFFARAKNRYLQIQTAIYLAPCALYLGNFRQARDAVKKGFEALAAIPEETGGEAALCMAQAMTALFEGRFSEAQACVDKCHALAQEHGLEAFDFLSLDIGGWLKTAVGDYASAEQLLRQCRTKGEESRNVFFSASAAHLLAVNYLHQNKPDLARAEADYALASRKQSGSSLFYGISLALSGAIELRRNRHAQAERMLREALAIFRQNSACQQEATVLLLLATLSRQTKRKREVGRLLDQAFEIGEEQGFTYYPLLTRAEVADLATAALEERIRVDYCESLVRKRREGTAVPFVKLFCFGGFKVLRGRAAVTDGQWKSSRAKMLLKLLASQDGLTLPRDAAFELLWPDADPDASGPMLNSMLSRIRRILDPGGKDGKEGSCILLKDGVILLNRDRVWTDTEQFLAHVEAAERLRKRGTAGHALEEYAQAVALYQGDFLPEDLAADWAAPVRDRLRINYLKALENMAALAGETGDREQSQSVHERLFLADPCNETVCCWLMSRYHSDGRRNDAIRTYERCELALRRDLDLAPEERTKKLLRSIIGGA